LALITVLNLRGLGDTARAFLLPTMLFIVGLLLIIAIGLIHPLALHAPPLGHRLVPTSGLEAVGILLVLKAFAAGCSALTGVEAIANGVPLFRQPRQVRAKRTEALLGIILGVMLVGLAILAVRFHIAPRSGQTVLSQIMATAVGRNWLYYIVSLAITAALGLAANTSFGGLPVLSSLLARDNYLPHLFALRGDRNNFRNGILALAVLSAALLVAVGGNTQRLIPLFAIGVFIGFTLSQTGLVVHWWRERPPNWQRRAAINGLGATVTALSTIVFLFTKFTEGGWVVVVAIPFFIFLFRRIHGYYQKVGSLLGFGTIPPKPRALANSVVVPVTNVSLLTARALGDALSIGGRAVAVTVVTSDSTEEEIEALRSQWDRWSPGVPLKIIHTEYASVLEPILEVIDHERMAHDRQVIVIIPVIIPTKLRYRLLHNHLDYVLSRGLRDRTDVITARVTVALDEVAQPDVSAHGSHASDPSGSADGAD
jgi:hypothetical protein